jgi:8-oxo-dGTP pyrophosphatase MutT (NUDIX family)
MGKLYVPPYLHTAQNAQYTGIASGSEWVKIADINKIGALCIRGKKLLVVHKKGINDYISLGGRIEEGETDLQCLQREVKEELCCDIERPEFYDIFEGHTYDGKTIRMPCYFIELKGEIRLNPHDNVDGFEWIDKDYKQKGITLAPILEMFVVPKLIKEGLL